MSDTNTAQGQGTTDTAIEQGTTQTATIEPSGSKERTYT